MKGELMDELIYRYALLRQIEKDSEGTLGSYGENWQFINTIRKMTTIDRHPIGHWIYGEDEVAMCDGYRCDRCGFFVPWDYEHKFIDFINDYHFCPSCGARMVKHD